jgi:hypothetical protein
MPRPLILIRAPLCRRPQAASVELSDICRLYKMTLRFAKCGTKRSRVGGGERNVFTIIRKFTLTRGSAGEVVRRVQDGFVPLLRELPGFRSYYLFDGGPEVLVSIRVFDSVDEALSSNEVAAEWMRNNVLEFTKGMPEVMAGHVLVAEAK